MGVARFIVFLSVAPLVAFAQSAQRPFWETVLPWLPANTESLYVSNVPLLLSEKQEAAQALLAFSAAMVGADEAAPATRAFLEMKVQAAVYAGRRFHDTQEEGLGMVGMMDACSILKLALGASGRLETELRSTASEIVLGSRVYTQGTNGTERRMALLEPSIFVSCSDGGLLKEILARRQAKATRAALPANLPEWRWINRTSKAWGIRHYPSRSTSDLTSREHEFKFAFAGPAGVGVAFQIVSATVAKFTWITSDLSITSLGIEPDGGWKSKAVVIEPGVIAVETNPKTDDELLLFVLAVLLGLVPEVV